ncbi:hypothetical protein D5R55_02075 [Burkholderia cenocepacia]|uniref:Uncharacterized protein n=1 Tax=Burkholderia cenocepacia TaxID=95486 RepID=A0A3Q9F0H0_9BURK|nr:hypothetical protein D5R55_02075 [Burkholderia cenocepacia]
MSWCERRASVGPGAPEYGHVDTTRNRAAPKVELALIAIDFSGLKTAMQRDGWVCARRMPVRTVRPRYSEYA